jgi:hypothetical protein
VREQCHETAKDRAGCLAAELLVRHGPHQPLERSATPVVLQAAGADLQNQIGYRGIPLGKLQSCVAVEHQCLKQALILA